tara:strand:- start:47 stop:925 length:879 start_codon:yes stop_codon:yes gene_type:complete
MPIMGPLLNGVSQFIRDILSLTVGTDVVHKDQGNVNYNSLQQFQSFMRSDDNHPSYTNLYTVQFAPPPIFQNLNGKFQLGNSENSKLLDYYCQSVSLPSKQITSGQVANVGSGYKYATGSAFSQMQMNFMMPRSQRTRTLFERWMSLMANDANQYVEYYNDYCASTVRIFKWERGGGNYASYDDAMRRALAENDQQAALKMWQNARLNKITAMWELRNVFPYNIGSAQLNNSASSLMTIGVSFYYERYRFYASPRFEDDDLINKIQLPSQSSNYWDGHSGESLEAGWADVIS